MRRLGVLILGLCALLGVTRSTLFNKMRKYGLLDRRGTSAVGTP